MRHNRELNHESGAKESYCSKVWGRKQCSMTLRYAGESRLDYTREEAKRDMMSPYEQIVSDSSTVQIVESSCRDIMSKIPVSRFRTPEANGSLGPSFSGRSKRCLEWVRHVLLKGSDRCRNHASTRLPCILVLATSLVTAV
jgi:hypothetical protein